MQFNAIEAGSSEWNVTCMGGSLKFMFQLSRSSSLLWQEIDEFCKQLTLGERARLRKGIQELRDSLRESKVH